MTASRPPDPTPATAATPWRTAVLAMLRGALIDLLATGDLERTTAAVEEYLAD